MAIGTPYAVGPTTTSVATTNAPTWINSTAAIPAGDTLFLFYSGRLNADFVINSITNNGGLSLTAEQYQANNNTQNGELIVIRIYASVTIPINTTFTFNLSASPTRHEASGMGVAGVANATPDANHQGLGLGTTNTALAATTAGSCASGEFAIGVNTHTGAAANGLTGTPSTGFTEWQDGPSVGASTPFLHQYVEYQALTGSGTVTSQPTFGSNSGGEFSIIVVFQPASTSTPKNTTESGSGSEASTEKAVYTGAQSGSGAEVSTEKVVHSRTDSATGSDTSRSYRGRTDSGSGSDVKTAKAVLSRTESGVGSDVSSQKAKYTYLLRANRKVVWIGQTNQNLGIVTLENAQRLAGRRFVGLRQNQQYTTTGITQAEAYFDAGYKRSYRDIQVETLSGNWAAVPTGGADTQIDAIGANLLASTRFNFNNPIIICIHHETTVSFGTYGTAQDYINMFRYWRNRWDAAGVTRYKKDGTFNGGPVDMAYIGWDRMFTNGAVNSPTAGQSYTDLDPDLGSSPAPAGTSYYEYAGSDIYNAWDSVGNLKYGNSAATLFDDVVAQATSRGKEFIVPEFGVGDGATTTDHTNKAAFLTSVKNYVKALPVSGPGACRGIWLTYKDSTEGMMLDSSSQALTAYQDLLNDPWFTADLTDEEGISTDTSTQKIVLSRTDSGTGTDSSSVTTGLTNKSGTDSGTGTDAKTLKAVLPRTESGTGSDVKTLKVVLSRTQSGTGTDTKTLNTGSTLKSASDSGVGTDLSISTVFPVDATLHLSTVVQGSDGTLWMGNGIGASDHRCIAKSTNGGNTWTWMTPAANISNTIWNTTRTWWLASAFPSFTSPANFSVSQLKVDPVDPNVVYSAGRAGVWQTRNGGTLWRPCMNGQDGSEANAFAIGLSGEAWCSDTDYTASHTTDFWNQANRQTTSLPTFQTPALTRVSGGNTYVVNAGVTPPTLKINGGSDKFNDFARAACVNPKDIGIMSDGTILISLSGGILVGRPSGANYTWSKGGQSGGGYCNAMDVDPRGNGATLAGDVWAFNATDDLGDNWYACNLGQAPDRPYGRAVCYSKKHPGRRYVGVGTLRFASGTGGGYLGVIDPALTGNIYQLDQVNTSVSFTTHMATGSASQMPRPVGNLIAVDYDQTANIEYLYCLTRQGLKMSTDKGVTLTDLGLPAPPDPNAWSAVAVMPNGDLLVSTFRTSDTDGSILYWVQNPRSGSPNIVQVLGVPNVIEDICLVTLGSRQVMMLACGTFGLVRINGLFTETQTSRSLDVADTGSGSETTTRKAVLSRTDTAAGTELSQVTVGGRIPVGGTTEHAFGFDSSVRIAQPTILRD